MILYYQIVDQPPYIHIVNAKYRLPASRHLENLAFFRYNYFFNFLFDNYYLGEQIQCEENTLIGSWKYNST